MQRAGSLLVVSDEVSAVESPRSAPATGERQRRMGTKWPAPPRRTWPPLSGHPSSRHPPTPAAQSVALPFGSSHCGLCHLETQSVTGCRLRRHSVRSLGILFLHLHVGICLQAGDSDASSPQRSIKAGTCMMPRVSARSASAGNSMQPPHTKLVRCLHGGHSTK